MMPKVDSPRCYRSYVSTGRKGHNISYGPHFGYSVKDCFYPIFGRPVLYFVNLRTWAIGGRLVMEGS
jgi:hypothetical protein